MIPKKSDLPSPHKSSSGKPPLRYQAVESYILDFIRKNKLQPGDAIPTLASMKKVLKMNDISLRRGVQELISKNVLESQQGCGTFVTEGALPCILWVNSLELHSGLDSPRTYDLFRLVEKRCHERGFRLVPVTLQSSDFYEPVLTANGGDGVVAGYIFSSCSENHRLLRRAREWNIPHVDRTANRTSPSHCTHPDQAQAIQIGREWLIERGHSEISFILYGDAYEPPLITRAKLEYHRVPWGRFSAAEVEAKGYYLGRDLILNGRLFQTVYIADDILAKGVTRAILAHHPQPRSLEIVIQGTTHNAAPFGLPTHLMSYNLEDHADAIMEILDEQLKGNPNPKSRYIQYRLHSKQMP